MLSSTRILGVRSLQGYCLLASAPVAPSERTISERIRRVPPGYVTTYGDLSPGAPRHAGRVLSQAPENVPWWRVVRSDGAWPKGQRQGGPVRGSVVLRAQARFPREPIL